MTLVKTITVLTTLSPDDPYRLAWEAMQKQPAEAAPRAPTKSHLFALMYQDPTPTIQRRGVC